MCSSVFLNFGRFEFIQKLVNDADYVVTVEFPYVQFWKYIVKWLKNAALSLTYAQSGLHTEKENYILVTFQLKLSVFKRFCLKRPDFVTFRDFAITENS